MAHQPKLFLLTGASGAGKSTILKAILEDPVVPVERFVTMTTRDMRPGEVDGKDYWFVSKDEFQKEREAGQLFESAEVYGQFYGSHKKEHERMKETGTHKIMAIDIQGAETLKRALPNAVTIFIDASPKEMEARLRERGTTEEDLERRMTEMKKERAYKDRSDYVVTNAHGKLEEATQETRRIIRSLV